MRGSKDLRLRLEQAINLEVTQIDFERGMVILNDSISISGNSYLLEECSDTAGGFKKGITIDKYPGPYRVYNRAKNVILYLIKLDTVCFKFIPMHFKA